jgi:rfaE bifunctional protein kinase chain/domain
MTPERLRAITSRYASLRLAVVGDFCLDRYLEIDPARAETSIETGLPVRNVVGVRAQPGAAGTVLNNLVALGVGAVHAVGFTGDDGEGYELRRALGQFPGVKSDHLLTTAERRTFTYCKPTVCEPGKPQRELERLDSKNWTPTPATVSARIARSIASLTGSVDGFIVMDQVDVAETGVVTSLVRSALRDTARAHAKLPMIADSRRGLHGYPPLVFKMNAAELASLTGSRAGSVEQVRAVAATLAKTNARPVFITMAERGIIGALADGTVEHVVALPLRGPIDVVGAGDSVTANLTAALAAGASLREAIELAILASSLVIHQLGTTGTADVAQIAELLPLLTGRSG